MEAFPAVGRDLGIWRRGGGEDSGQQAGGWAGAEGLAPREVLSCQFPQVAGCSVIWAPPPVATVAGSGRLGSSLRAGWRGGGWRLAGASTRNVCPGNVTALPTEWGGGRVGGWG